MRGKVPTFHPPSGAVGITPAVCGEKAFVRSCCASRTGSPPRMRGKVQDRLRSSWSAGDHPRVCGEKVRLLPVSCIRSGSPPRMRGKDSCSTEFQQQSGITPAYAGKSFWPQFAIAVCQDHPRVCGEKRRVRKPDTQTTGSPPRMRGKVFYKFSTEK